MSRAIDRLHSLSSRVEVFKDGEITQTSIRDIVLKSGKSRALLFFYPADFTFICPTEIIELNKQVSKFNDLDTVVLGLSADTVHTHKAWVNTPKIHGGLGGLTFGLVADKGARIASDLGAVQGSDITRTALLITPRTGTVHFTITVQDNIGRNINELIRLTEAVEFTENNPTVCPANWTRGADTIETNLESTTNYLTKLR